jgi:hypothetical protein
VVGSCEHDEMPEICCIVEWLVAYEGGFSSVGFGYVGVM